MKTRFLAALLLPALLAAPALAGDGEGKAPDPGARFLAARKVLLRGDPATAAELFRVIVREAPKADVADDCLYWMGRCWLRLADREPDAVVALLRLFREYPESPWLDDAARELARLGDRTIVPELLARLDGAEAKAEPAARALAEFGVEAGLTWLADHRGEDRPTQKVAEAAKPMARDKAEAGETEAGAEIAALRREVARLRVELEEALALLAKLIAKQESGADGAGEDGR